MKLILLTSLMSVACLVAQTPAAKPAIKGESQPAEKRSANDITIEITNQIKSIFEASASAKDEATVKIALASINKSTESILKLKTDLKGTAKPTTEEKKQCAAVMIEFETSISEIIKTMSKTFADNTEEINALIEPSITSSKAKIAPAIALINDYYPKEEMDGYMRELKEQQKEK